MSTTSPNFTYKQMLEAVRRRDSEDRSFTAMLNNVSTQLDSLDCLTTAKYVASIGTGYGQRDLEFAERFLPSMTSFTAIEPADECAEVLRSMLPNRLPGVSIDVLNQEVQNWKLHPRGPLDVVLAFHSLYYLSNTERIHLARMLFNRVLRPGGCLVALLTTPAFRPALKRISPLLRDDCYPPVVVLEQEILSVGFVEVLRRRYINKIDMKQPFEDEFVAFMKCHCRRPISLEETREIMQHMYDGVKSIEDYRYLVVFRKPA